jgi:hypothetical protein
MQVIGCVTLLVVASIVFYGYGFAVDTVNAHCIATYGFKPVSWLQGLCILPTVVFLLLAAFVADAGNIIASGALATLTGYANASYIAKRTTPKIAAVSLLLLLPLALLLGVLAISVLGWLTGSSDDRNHRK